MSKKGVSRVLIVITYAMLIFFLFYRWDLVKSTFSRIISVFAPFLAGGALAFILSTPINFFERTILKWANKPKLKKFKRPLSILLTFIIFAAIVTALVFIILPQIGATFENIANRFPGFATDVYELIISLPGEHEFLADFYNEINIDWKQIISNIMVIVENSLGNIFSSAYSIVTGLIQGVMNTIVCAFFAIYILFSKEKLAEQFKKLFRALFGEKRSSAIVDFFKLSHTSFSKFLTGQCLEAIILGTMFYIAMLMFDMPYVLLISVIITVTAFIPIFGAFIGCGVGAFFILIDSPIQAFWFIVLFLVIQQIEGNLIYPHVVGGSVGLPSIWVLMAVSIGGEFMGIFGMIIFIPIFSIAYTLIKKLTAKRLQKQAESNTVT